MANTSDNSRPRGIRNNNPGNIRWSNVEWRGLVPEGQRTDNTFCQFVDAFHGVRALALNLHTYWANHGLHTVRAIIERWAPPGENDTEAYIRCVAERMHVSADADISLADWLTLHNMVEAVITEENGLGPLIDGRWYELDVTGNAVSNVLGVGK